jgi:hypothetical protein
MASHPNQVLGQRHLPLQFMTRHHRLQQCEAVSVDRIGGLAAGLGGNQQLQIADQTQFRVACRQ